MLALIDEARRYTAAGEDAFWAEPMRQRAVKDCLQTIGEAAAKLSRELQERHQEVPWIELINDRNFQVHEYHRVEPAYLWKAAARLPRIERLIEQVHSREWDREPLGGGDPGIEL